LYLELKKEYDSKMLIAEKNQSIHYLKVKEEAINFFRILGITLEFFFIKSIAV